MGGALPEFGTAFGGSFRRIVQTPGSISIFYDIGQGQGWQRNIVMNGSPHLPARATVEGCSCRVGPGNFTPSLSQIRT
jgi:hypothetical protein